VLLRAIAGSDTTKVLRFNVENRTDEQINAIYVRTNGSPTWGQNLFTRLLNPDETTEIVLSELLSLHREGFDVQLISTTDKVYKKLNLHIAQDGSTHIIFNDSDIDLEGLPLKRITIQNMTGESVYFGNISRAGTSNWINLFSSSVSYGSSTTFVVPQELLTHSGNFDIQLWASSENIYTKEGVAIHSGGTAVVIFIPSDLHSEGTTQRRVTIQNSTGISVNFGNIRATGTTNWLNLFSSSMQNGASPTFLVPSAISSQNSFDIQLWASPNNTYTKLEIAIASDGSTVVTFTPENLDDEVIFYKNVIIQNTTGETLNFGNIRANGTLIWKSLFSVSLPNGSSSTYTLPSTLNTHIGTFDIQLWTAIGNTYTKEARPISLDGSTVLTFTLNDKDVEIVTQKQVTIQNSTNVPISFGNIRLNGQNEWINLFSTSLPNGASTTYVIPQEYYPHPGTFDIQLWTSSSTTYTRTNIAIASGGNTVVTFLSTDLDTDIVTERLVTIQNTTGSAVSFGNIRESGTTQWMSLFSTTLANGESNLFTLPIILNNHPDTFDIRLWTSMSTTYTMTAVAILFDGTSVLTFTQADLDVETITERSIILQNITGESISFGNIKGTAAAEWINLFSEPLEDGSSTVLTVPSTLGAINNFDLQLWSTSVFVYSKHNIVIAASGATVVTFTNADLDTDAIIQKRVIVQVAITGTLFFGNIRGRIPAAVPPHTEWINLFSENLDQGSSTMFTVPQVLNSYVNYDIQVWAIKLETIIVDEEEVEIERFVSLTKSNVFISPDGTTVITFVETDLD
jgi:hypothetical protein